MAYSTNEIEQKWQKFWSENHTFKAENNSEKPKYYVLDMFPYPSGAGLHVGHPLGYIASDIYTRYKRHCGFNVLHPMGYDAFGLPAEQYAIETGTHPAVTTDKNIQTYRKQLDIMGLSFDWSREVKTCDPSYYKWTQWAFIEMFNSYYDSEKNCARPIEELKAKNPELTERDLDDYRIAYLADTPVNWCPALGTVLANDEVKDGLSVRGGHPVEQKTMKQWNLRVSAYAKRLLDGLENIDWSDSLKEMQRHWIGKSVGAEVKFKVKDKNVEFDIFTTRPDTIFGVTFMVLAPESYLVDEVTTDSQKADVETYLEATKKKGLREREADQKNVSGVFTGSYAINPFNNKEIPIWIGDYVLGGYGTGAIMAVPAHDSRDYAFAKHFDLAIIPVIDGGDIEQGSYDAKEGKMINSDFLNGLEVKEAIEKTNSEVETRGLGKKKTQYRLRDAIFSRQRYWGEPFPVYFKDGEPQMLAQDELPLELPEVDAFLPTEDGDPPLGRAKNWKTSGGDPLELSTMPGFAGSSAYFLRYMDPNNNQALVDKSVNAYWKNVDLYLGGSEHATGHLIYARFWNMFLFDRGYICEEEPFQKLINQGMIQGRSNFVYRLKSDLNTFVSHGLKDQYDVQEFHVDVNIVSNDQLDMEAFKAWRPDFKDANFITEQEGGQDVYKCGWAIEKMSKSKYNVVNPDDMVEKYGADTFRLYEMFLGPIEQSKPWNTNGIEGVSRFLNKFWNTASGELEESEPTKEELKILHTCIKKVSEDMENFSFNTSVAAFMIAMNDLSKIKSKNKSVFETLTVLLSPFAPHIAEELWTLFGHQPGISTVQWPSHNEEYLIESSMDYPVSFNGKMRFTLNLPLDWNKDQLEKAALEAEQSQKYLDGKNIKKVIVVPKKIINIVVG
jgi:leucyl-tRNA synthetase